MNNFKDFGIQPASKGLVGEKIKIAKILNVEITVHDFRIVDSKYGNTGNKCLHLQIGLGKEKRVVFTGSVSLMELIEQVPKSKFPFTTKIIEDNDRFLFS